MSYFMHPRLIQSMPAFYPTTGSVQQAVETLDAVNQPIKTWSDLVGNIDIPCRIETTGGNESKAVNQVYTTATHIITLAGYYPLVDPKMRFVDSDGNIYDILLVNHETFKTFTNLIAEIKR